MKTSQQILKDAGIVPRLRLGAKVKARAKSGKIVQMVKPTGAYRVKLLKDKEVTGRDNQTGKAVAKIRYLLDVLMPDGKTWENRIYETNKYRKQTPEEIAKNEPPEVSYLVQRMAEIPEGTEVIMEMTAHGMKNHIEVREIGESTAVEVEHEDDAPEEGIIE